MEEPTQPPSDQTVTPAPKPTKPLLPTWLIAAVVVVVGSIAVLWAVGVFSRGEQLTPTTAELVPTPTPTPIRTPSALATQSAFLAFEEAVASLSAHIQALPVSDPSLAPPTIELELGFNQ
jgi:hypothetical protein